MLEKGKIVSVFQYKSNFNPDQYWIVDALKYKKAWYCVDYLHDKLMFIRTSDFGDYKIARSGDFIVLNEHGQIYPISLEFVKRYINKLQNVRMKQFHDDTIKEEDIFTKEVTENINIIIKILDKTFLDK